MTFKHNKKRSTGIVYEMLVRRLSKTMVDRDRAGYQSALGIVRKYFGEGTILAEEKELFDVVRNTRGISEHAARRMLAQVVTEAAKLDRKKSDIKKSNLIKDINYTFGKGFWAEHRIPDYRLLATIQLVIDSSGPTGLTESVQRIQLEEGLVAHMTTKADAAIPTARPEQIDGLVMAMVAKRFNEKYSSSFNPHQKKLLERYIRYQVTGDERPLREYVATEHARISKLLFEATMSREVREDPIMLKRLDEARDEWDRNQTTELNAGVEKVMLFQKLAEEIESDE